MMRAIVLALCTLAYIRATLCHNPRAAELAPAWPLDSQKRPGPILAGAAVAPPRIPAASPHVSGHTGNTSPLQRGFGGVLRQPPVRPARKPAASPQPHGPLISNPPTKTGDTPAAPVRTLEASMQPYGLTISQPPVQTRVSQVPNNSFGVPVQTPDGSAGYLYPVLAWGPNNQIAGLKEALVLGRLLNRTVILHDILNHYDDQATGGDGEEPQVSAMDFSQVFDRSALSRHQSVVTLAELRAAGWNSSLQAVAHFGDMFLSQIKTAHALNVSDEGALYLDFGSHFNCSHAQLARIAAKLAPYKYVAFIVYENVVRDAGHGVKLRANGHRCHDEYLQVSGQMRKSDGLVEMARSFLRQRLGGPKRRFLAVHIRPYPDTCLHVWRRRRWRRLLAHKECKNPHLYDVFVNQTQEAMAHNRLTHLFVMTYPDLRPRITKLYGKVGLQPIFYDKADLEAAVGYMSISLLGMVEEEIAFEASAFIGTSYSSMSWMIMQERFARGKPSSTTSTFVKTT